jgi:hypothetical protein
LRERLEEGVGRRERVWGGGGALECAVCLLSICLSVSLTNTHTYTHTHTIIHTQIRMTHI